MNPKKKNNYEVISKFLKNSQKKPEASSAVYRHQFDARKQQSNENLHEFHIALLDLGGKGFPELEQKTLDKYVREQFVQGVSNKSLRERLVTDHHEITDPSELLDKATDMERLLQSVNMVERRSASNNEYTTQQNNRQPNETNQYTRTIKCYNCNKEGHLGRDCRTTYPNNHNNQQTDNNSPPLSQNIPNTSQQTMTLTVRERTSSLRELNGGCLNNNQKVNYMSDTGSSVSNINKNFLQSFNDPTVNCKSRPFKINVISAKSVEVFNQYRARKEQAVVVQNGHQREKSTQQEGKGVDDEHNHKKCKKEMEWFNWKLNEKEKTIQTLKLGNNKLKIDLEEVSKQVNDLQSLKQTMHIMQGEISKLSQCRLNSESKIRSVLVDNYRLIDELKQKKENVDNQEGDLDRTQQEHREKEQQTLIDGYKIGIATTECKLPQSKVNYDRKVCAVNYQVNELVWLQNKTHDPSKKIKWIGPYIVVDKIKNLNYAIKPANCQGRRITVHINLLKRCNNRARPPDLN